MKSLIMLVLFPIFAMGSDCQSQALKFIPQAEHLEACKKLGFVGDGFIESCSEDTAKLSSARNEVFPMKNSGTDWYYQLSDLDPDSRMGYFMSIRVDFESKNFQVQEVLTDWRGHPRSKSICAGHLE